MTDLSGTLEGVGLPAVVRFLSGLHKTGRLRITHQDWTGDVFFAEGRVVSAALGTRRGLSALDALVQALPGGSFTFTTDLAPPANADIDLDPEALQAHLDDLVQRTRSGSPTLPSLDAVPRVVPLADESPTEDSVPLDRGTLQTLLAVDGTRTVSEVVAKRASVEALWQLANLTELGLVRIERNAAPAPTPVQADPTPEQPGPPPIQAEPAAHSAAPRMVEPTQPAPVSAAVPTVPEATTVVESLTPAAASAETPGTAIHCPKLGFEDDPTSSFGRPTRLHRCFAAATPLPLSLDQQRELCLSEQYGTCPRLTTVAEAQSATPPTPTPGYRRRGIPVDAAPPASTPSALEGEANPADPRIVRLPFGGRTAGNQRGAAAADRQTAGAEPARLRPPMASLRDAGAVRPMPLRTRPQRPGGAQATAEVREPLVAPHLVADTEPRSAVPDLAEPANATSPRRGMPVPAPVLATAGVGLAIIAIAVALVLPNLGLIGEPEINRDTLPNSSAVVAGTPVTEIAARPTVAAPAAADTAATVATQPGTAAQPAQPASPPTAAPTAAATAAAAATGPRNVVDETFDDNALGWPNNSEGVASVSGGTLRISPRVATQFVALGAPIPDIVRDVIVSATFRKLGGPSGGGYGIIVRDQGPGPRDGQNQVGRYYVLEAGDKGEIGIWRRDGERWIDLLPWQSSTAVRPGNEVNELTVRAIGDRLSLSVNGAEVATQTDSVLPAGGVGIFVGGDGNQVAVEQFSVQVP